MVSRATALKRTPSPISSCVGGKYSLLPRMTNWPAGSRSPVALCLWTWSWATCHADVTVREVHAPAGERLVEGGPRGKGRHTARGPRARAAEHIRPSLRESERRHRRRRAVRLDDTRQRAVDVAANEDVPWPEVSLGEQLRLRDAAEIQPRYSRGAAEVQPRCSRGAAEVQPTCGRSADLVQISCRYRADLLQISCRSRADLVPAPRHAARGRGSSPTRRTTQTSPTSPSTAPIKKKNTCRMRRVFFFFVTSPSTAPPGSRRSP